MTTVFDLGNQGNADSPGTHVFIIGVGEYPCLVGGDPARLLNKPMGLGQLSSPPLSAVALADWFIGRQVPDPGVDECIGFHNPHAPLASVEMLVSPGFYYQCRNEGSVTVAAATRDNIAKGYRTWRARAKSNPGNIAVFFFCGHGAAGSSDYILPSDFGEHNPENPWADAIDITETARAARREVGGSLYFFIDACRQASRDSLMPGASTPALQYVDFDKRVLCFTRMLLWATGEGEPAFGAKGHVSRFTAALIDALSGFYGEEADGGNWAVAGEALAKSVRIILDASNATLDDARHQHDEAQLIGSQILHYETREPKRIGRMVSTWSANPEVRKLAQIGAEPLAEGAQEALVEQMEQRNVQVEELRREIEGWTRRYHELEQRLADEPDSELAQQARSYLAEGKLEEAGALLDNIIKEAEARFAAEHVRLASHYLSRAEVYALQFKLLEALPFFRKAYELFPEEPQYALPYAFALRQQNNYQGAEDIYTSTLLTLRQRAENNPPDSPREERALDNSDTARLNEAESVYWLDMAMTLNNLGNLYSLTRRLTEAEAAYQEALDIYRKLTESNPAAYRSYIAMALNNVGRLRRATERLTEAETAYDEALSIFRKLVDTNPATYQPYVAATLNNLGLLYHDTERLAEAETAYDEALNICRKLAEANPAAHQDNVATTLNNLGLLYRDTNRKSEAETACQEALGIRQLLAEASADVYQPKVAETLNTLGSIYCVTGRLTKAETAHDKALNIYRERAQADLSAYRLVAATLNDLGTLYRNTGRPAEAESAYREALDIYHDLAKANPAPFGRAVATAYNNLGLLYRDTGHLAEAEAAYREALDICHVLAEANPAAYLPDVATTLNYLGLLHRDTKSLSEAEAALQESLDIRRKLVEANAFAYQPEVAATLNSLGLLYQDAGRLSEAEATLRESLEIRRKLAEVNPSVYAHIAATLSHLGKIYRATLRLTEAETTYREALDINRKLAEGNPADYGRYVTRTVNVLDALKKDRERPV